MQDRKRLNARTVALGGVLLALMAVVLFITSITPVNKLSMYALASFFVSIVVVEAGIGAGWIFYAASIPMAFLIMRDYTAVLPYVLFFGAYGLVKYHIELLHNIFAEYILKIVYFCSCILLVYAAARQFLFRNAEIGLPAAVLIPLFVLAFLIYDYAYMLFIRYYQVKIRSRLKS